MIVSKNKNKIKIETDTDMVFIQFCQKRAFG